jgi:mannosyltransferase
MSRVAVAALALVTSATLLLRTGILDSGYWIDEAITVGIASHDLGDIPRALRLDGSPPLFYLLLHGWMAVVGTGEAATRALPLLFALLAVPVSWWAGDAVFGRRAGALAAAGAAGCPFLTYYAQETRMYSLVAVLSVLACASFVLAFVHGRRRHLWLLGLWLVLLLYAHNWALFLAGGMAAAWLWLWREGRVGGRDGALLAGGVALLYAPWVPSLVFQAANTAAPWSSRPSPLSLLGIPGGLFGSVAVPLLALAAVAALRRRPAPEGARLLALVAAFAAALAFLGSQLEPAWATRYLAVLFGPLLLALAAVLARGAGWTWLALAGVAGVWLASGPAPAKSNVRTVAATVAPALRPGDLVVCTQPEQVPVLYRYLPRGLLFLTPLGTAAKPEVVDWQDGVARLRAGTAARVLAPFVGRLAPGRRVLVVMPVYGRRLSQAPWNRAVRSRTREWRAWLRADPRLRSRGRAPRSTWPRWRSVVRTQLFEVHP